MLFYKIYILEIKFQDFVILLVPFYFVYILFFIVMM